MINARKGITPVIAIVLLLLITVGAVGVVYTQFQGLVNNNNAEEQLNNQQEVQQASYSFVAVETSGADTFNATLQNTGDNTLNFGNTPTTLLFGPNGESPTAVTVAGDGPCSWSNTAPGPGETTSCEITLNADYEMTDDAVAETIEFRVGEATKDTYNCNYDNSGSC